MIDVEGSEAKASGVCIRRYDIKEANGLDYSDELEQALTLMSEHTPSKKQMDEYRNYHRELALTALGEQLSDIPMGRLIQFQDAFERELDKFKKTYFEYRNGNVTIEAVIDEYEIFCAVIECFDNALDENSENDEYEIPGLDDEDVFANCVTVDVDETDINKYYESLEYVFRCFECLVRYARKIMNNHSHAVLTYPMEVVSRTPSSMIIELLTFNYIKMMSVRT